MADTLHLTGQRARAPLYLVAQKHPIIWIKRRARRLERAFQISRREAIENARIDWACFQPASMH